MSVKSTVRLTGTIGFKSHLEKFAGETPHRKDAVSVPRVSGLSATIHEDADDWLAHSQHEGVPGSICFIGEGGMGMCCPGCGHASYVPFTGKGPKWEMCGDKAFPTIEPSIKSAGCCNWHGWLQDGIWYSV